MWVKWGQSNEILMWESAGPEVLSATHDTIGQISSHAHASFTNNIYPYCLGKPARRTHPSCAAHSLAVSRAQQLLHSRREGLWSQSMAGFSILRQITVFSLTPPCISAIKSRSEDTFQKHHNFRGIPG